MPESSTPRPRTTPSCIRKRRWIAATSSSIRWWSSKYLTKPQANYAKTFPLGLSKAYEPARDACEAAGSAAFFCDYVRSTLLNDPKFGATPEIRQRRLFEGGLTIKTSIDPDVQAEAQSAVDTIIPPGGRIATADVVMQPGTGDVLAMAVNRIYGDTTDHLPVYGVVKTASSWRARTGSTPSSITRRAIPAFSPVRRSRCSRSRPRWKRACRRDQFLLARLRLSGELRYRTRPAEPAVQCRYAAALGGQLPPFGAGYANADPAEAGIYNMANATADSVNTYFVQLEKKVGLGRSVTWRAGSACSRLTLNGPAADLVGSLTLGSHEVSPLDMATAYATIAAHGLRCYPKPVLSMTVAASRSPTPDRASASRCSSPASPTRSRSLLEGVIQNGTATNNGQIGRPAAGKTGTTDEHYDAWFDGYIPQLAAAVWVGDGRSPTKYPLLSATPPGARRRTVSPEFRTGQRAQRCSVATCRP